MSIHTKAITGALSRTSWGESLMVELRRDLYSCSLDRAGEKGNNEKEVDRNTSKSSVICMCTVLMNMNRASSAERAFVTDLGHFLGKSFGFMPSTN